MRKSYIIEINDKYKQVVLLSADGDLYCKCVAGLTPYTEPDLDAIRNEAYEKGVEDTKQHWTDAPRSCAYRLGYEKGLNNAWDAARKICTNWVLSDSVLSKIFGIDKTIDDVMKENTASEAIEKIRQYEQEQKKIKVGDEVDGKGGRGIITKISDDSDHFNVMWENGSTGYYMIEDFKKTGRHFPEIAEVLRKMQEEKE